MSANTITRYAEQEEFDIRARAKEASRRWTNGDLDVKSLVHLMFGFEDHPPDQAQLMGPIDEHLLFGKTALTVWPHKTIGDASYHGLSFEELYSGTSQELVVPMIQEPYRYAFDASYQEFIGKFNPPSYFWRGNMVFSIMSGGDENLERVNNTMLSGEAVDWYRRGFENETIREAIHYRETWEPNHKTSWPTPLTRAGREYIRDSFAFKYLNACAFLTEDFVQTLLVNLPPVNALRFLTTFHMLTDHPMSHALLTNGTVALQSYEFQDFLDGKSDYFMDDQLSEELVSLPLKLLAKPLYEDVQDARNAGLVPLPFQGFSELGSFGKEELLAYQDALVQELHAYQDWVHTHRKGRALVDRVLNISAVGIGAGTLLEVIPQDALYVLFTKILIDEKVVDYVLDKLGKAPLAHLVTKVFDSDSS